MIMRFDAVAIGNAVIDYICPATERQLQLWGMQKSNVNFTEKHPADIRILPRYAGGSSANVMAGMAQLGCRCLFSASVGNDENGLFFRESLEKAGVAAGVSTRAGCTPTALAFITPDRERTFSVSLGVASDYRTQDLPAEQIRKTTIFHTSCYKLTHEPQKSAVLHAIQIAKKTGALVSLDLASASLVVGNMKFLTALIKKNVDILFANEEETRALSLPAAQLKGMMVCKMGEAGSVIISRKGITRILPYKTAVVNTNGAGDAYAAGFLYGICKGLDLKTCGHIGSFCASAVVAQEGARLALNAQEKVYIKRVSATGLQKGGPSHTDQG
jgi:sugar/nucleoside kinase (ribokinase family)